VVRGIVGPVEVPDAARPTQEGAEPEISLIPDQVCPPSWLTASTSGTVTSDAAWLPITYLIHVTITFPSPHPARTGWSWKMERQLKEPFPAATTTGVDHVTPPSADLDTTTSGVLLPPSASVVRYAAPSASNAIRDRP
jgi:hypothetical protein